MVMTLCKISFCLTDPSSLIDGIDHLNSLLPGLKLERPIFSMALPVPGHERVKITFIDLFILLFTLYKPFLAILGGYTLTSLFQRVCNSIYN